MISVTVAAHGRTKRVVGGNLRAYGSGRLSICDLNRENGSQNNKDCKGWKIFRLLEKLAEIFSAFMKFLFPSFFSPTRPLRPVRSTKKPLQPFCNQSIINQLDDDVLFNIISNLDAKTIVACEAVCHRFNAVIAENIAVLPKIATDQIRVLFDEGEVVIYPLDEKRCPTRYPMPSLQVLGGRLRHLTTQSLFVRGLIPVESSPVLRLLKSLVLQPQQIYFIWSKFSPDSIILLEEFIYQNSDTVSDFGLEECSPSHLLTDRLLSPIAHHLTSLRLWNNGKGSHYAITDETMFSIAEAVSNGIPVETIDLATCIISNESVISIIDAWVNQPTSDLSISLSHCGPVERSTVLEQLVENNIYFEADHRLRINGFTLTLFC